MSRDNSQYLQPSWMARRQRSAALVREAIGNLKLRGAELSRRQIHEETKRVDPEGRGVHPSTYGRNVEVEALVTEALGETSKVRRHLDLSQVNIRHLRAGRDPVQVFHRLCRVDSVKLAGMVVALELEVISLRAELAEAYGVFPLDDRER